jgi:hypothetical protein
MFEKIKNKIRYYLDFLAYLYSTDIHPPAKEGNTKRAYFIAWVVETAIGSLLFFVLFGTVAMPQFYAVSTSGWTTYSVVLWVLIPLICIGGFIVRVIRSAQSGYVGPITGY